MIDISRLKKGQHFFHAGIGEIVFDREATAELLGCSKANLNKLQGKNGLNPLKSRLNRLAVYAQSDIKAFLARR